MGLTRLLSSKHELRGIMYKYFMFRNMRSLTVPIMDFDLFRFQFRREGIWSKVVAWHFCYRLSVPGSSRNSLIDLICSSFISQFLPQHYPTIRVRHAIYIREWMFDMSSGSHLYSPFSGRMAFMVAILVVTLNSKSLPSASVIPRIRSESKMFVVYSHIITFETFKIPLSVDC